MSQNQPGSLQDSEVEEALSPVPSTASPFDQTGSFLHVGRLLTLLLLLLLLMLLMGVEPLPGVLVVVPKIPHLNYFCQTILLLRILYLLGSASY